MRCRFCQTPLTDIVIDLGDQPSANRLLAANDINRLQQFKLNEKMPLAVFLCSNCALVQLGDVEKPETLFTGDYVYYSSYSKAWVNHAKTFVTEATKKFSLSKASNVLEIGSNDGYLLQHFVISGIPARGVDPAAQAAKLAKEKGVDTFVGFFGADMVDKIIAEFGQCDLIVGNNVLAHIPDIRGHVQAIKQVLSDDGVVSLEFPHLANLVEFNLFDTIYDEHYYYFSILALQRIFIEFGLKIIEIDELDTHGGSLRVFATHQESARYETDGSVEKIIEREHRLKLDQLDGYANFQKAIEEIRDVARSFISNERQAGRTIAGFGAAAKGNIFLNYCDLGVSDIEFVADDTPAKQGKYLPGTHIPVTSQDAIRDRQPDIVVILAWNFRDEICQLLDYTQAWECRLVTFVPAIKEN